MAGKECEKGKAVAVGEEEGNGDLAASLADLFTNVSTMVQGELQGTSDTLILLEKMNLRVAEEYKSFGDTASGLRIYAEQLNKKNNSFEEYVQQIDAIDKQVTEFEAAISMLDNYVSLLESKVYRTQRVTNS